MEKVAKNGRKVKAIYSLTFFAVFCPFMKNGRKVKAIAPYFFAFLPIYEKWEKSLKMDEKLRL